MSHAVAFLQVVLSPGPGNPTDFALSTTIEFLTTNSIPGFGVCLGLQGMVEHFGGTLGVLGYPMHGKPSMVHLTKAGLAENRYVLVAHQVHLGSFGWTTKCNFSCYALTLCSY